MKARLNPLLLSDSEREELEILLRKGKHSVRKLKRAKVLLLLASGRKVPDVAQAAGVSEATVYNVYHRYEPGKLAKALEECPRSGQPRKVTERLEAEVTRMACSQAPDGRSGWTVSLLHEQVVEWGYQLDDESVRGVLKKVNLNPGKKGSGVSGR